MVEAVKNIHQVQRKETKTPAFDGGVAKCGRAGGWKILFQPSLKKQSATVTQGIGCVQRMRRNMENFHILASSLPKAPEWLAYGAGNVHRSKSSGQQERSAVLRALRLLLGHMNNDWEVGPVTNGCSME